MNAYGFIIRNGNNKIMSSSINYVIFSETEDEAYSFCQDYVESEMIKDKQRNDGEYFLWKHYRIEKTELSKIGFANIKCL